MEHAMQIFIPEMNYELNPGLIMLISPQAVAVILVSVGPTQAQLIGDIDKDALKAKVEEQTDEPEKDSKFILPFISSISHIIIFFLENDIVVDVGVLCNSEDITLTLTVTTDTFNGMIYPKGLSKNSTCMTEYIQQEVS